jgi:hypothetical protein
VDIGAVDIGAEESLARRRRTRRALENSRTVRCAGMRTY